MSSLPVAADPTRQFACFVVLVTGGTRGIGKGIALNLAKRFGAKITLVLNYSRNESDATKTSEEIAELTGGKKPLLIRADLSEPRECERLMAETIAQGRRLDVIVLNHGIAVSHDIGDLTLSFEAFCQTLHTTMKVNFEACAQLSFLAIRQFISQIAAPESVPQKLHGIEATHSATNGRLVFVSSRAAVRGELEMTGYAASKGALSIFGQSLARRFAEKQIMSTVLEPGWVRTEMAAEVLQSPQRDEILRAHPLGRVAEVSEVADTVIFCAIDAPLAMTGTIIDVNGASYLS